MSQIFDLHLHINFHLLSSGEVQGKVKVQVQVFCRRRRRQLQRHGDVRLESLANKVVAPNVKYLAYY